MINLKPVENSRLKDATSVISSNNYQANALGLFKLYRKSGTVARNQLDLVDIFSEVDKVGGNQGIVFGGMNITGTINGNHVTGINLIDIAKNIQYDKQSLASLFSYNSDTSGSNRSFITGFNVSDRIGGEQEIWFNGINITGKVEGIQDISCAICNATENVERNQGVFFGGLNYTGKVGRNQFRGISGLNRVREIGENQIGAIGLVNLTDKVYGNQLSLIEALNVAGEVKENQLSGISALNYTGRVGKNQRIVLGAVNIAGKVEGDQTMLLGGLNYAGKVGGDQRGGLVAVQTNNKKAHQKYCVVRYNPTEGFGLGGSVWSKLDKARKYVIELSRENADNREKYQEILRSFVRSEPSLTKRLTGHWTYSDVLSREAKRRLDRMNTRRYK